MVPVTFIHSLISFLSMFLAYAFVVTCAGVFSAWVALKLGDDTPARFGHLSWHPLAHMDVIGALSLLFVGFGWGRVILFDYHNLSRPWGVIATYLSALPVYFLLSLSSLVALIKFFGIKFIKMSYEIFADKLEALSKFFVLFPDYSSLALTVGYILLSVLYISILLITLDIISRGFQIVLILFFPEAAQNMYHDMRLFFIPLLLMIIFIQPVFAVVHTLIVVLSNEIAAIIG